ncbi:MAG: QueT transporter family protein [Nitrososphaerota archaeon]|nr:QueT transporter family protein [Candidatus Bathyarchaeota archaeon]MCX8161444.1 QueT transporter family protein [Candidatus Bathyarchaeota archaeon]MDW8061853.1 QueT transporter family protein [Nitrososphaerota archaeon]
MGYTKKIGFIALISSLYAVLTIIPGYLSFGPIQFRVSDMLIPLSAIYGYPACIAVTIGCMVANAYYFVGWLDIIVGPIANLLSSLLIYHMRRYLLAATIISSFIIGFIVGSYLWIFFPPPALGIPLHPSVLIGISVSASSLVTVSGLGYILVKSVSKILPENLKKL